jgi:uncharacterized protein (TIGR03437 family)
MRRLPGACLVAVLVFLAPKASSQSGKPLILSVTNAANYSSGPISPGEMVVIFGAEIGPIQLVNVRLDDQGRIATSLSEVQLLFDGIASPLIYVSQNQVSAMVPYSVTGKTSSQVQAVYRGVASAPFSKAVRPSLPGIFSANSSGKGQVAALNSDGSFNSSSNAAVPGSYITLFLTGAGQTIPPWPTGTRQVLNDVDINQVLRIAEPR